jgi:SulP family sulfate permease
VLDAEANINLDLTAAGALEELRARLADRGIIFATTYLRSELRAALTRTGWVDRVGGDHLFATLPTAVAAYEQWLGDHPATTPPMITLRSSKGFVPRNDERR